MLAWVRPCARRGTAHRNGWRDYAGNRGGNAPLAPEFSSRVFGYFQSDVFPTDYPDADMLILLHRAGFRVEEQPVAMRASLAGSSSKMRCRP